VVGRIRELAQHGAHGRHAAEASRIDLEQRRALLDGDLLDRDLLDATTLGEPTRV
jgi:hypothetical protein